MSRARRGRKVDKDGRGSFSACALRLQGSISVGTSTNTNAPAQLSQRLRQPIEPRRPPLSEPPKSRMSLDAAPSERTQCAPPRQISTPCANTATGRPLADRPQDAGAQIESRRARGCVAVASHVWPRRPGSLLGGGGGESVGLLNAELRARRARRCRLKAGRVVQLNQTRPRLSPFRGAAPPLPRRASRGESGWAGRLKFIAHTRRGANLSRETRACGTMRTKRPLAPADHSRPRALVAPQPSRPRAIRVC